MSYLLAGRLTMPLMPMPILTPPQGRQATANVKESLEWGTKIVGGVKPGVEGEHLGLPVFPSVKVVRIDCSGFIGPIEPRPAVGFNVNAIESLFRRRKSPDRMLQQSMSPVIKLQRLLRRLSRRRSHSL